MLSAEGIGKNLEQAIENALFELKAPREDVDIKIISEGGLFKKARVVVTISEDAKDKYIKRSQIRQDEERLEKAKMSFDGALMEEKPTAKEKSKEKKREKALEKAGNKESAVGFGKKAVFQEESASVECAKKEKVGDVKATACEINEDEKEGATDNEYAGMDAMEFLKGLFEVAGKEVEIKVIEDEKYVTYSVEGDDLGDMIGHRGDCYYAINRILSAVTGKHEKRVLLDIGGYRAKREESLTALAKRTAERVARSGRYSRLDPMNASERRIIHSALADDDRVVTMSRGEEPKRYVMIFPKGEER